MGMHSDQYATSDLEGRGRGSLKLDTNAHSTVKMSECTRAMIRALVYRATVGLPYYNNC